MSGRVIVNPGSRSPQSLERARGLDEPLDPVQHYRVEPGDVELPDDDGEPEPSPEFFPRQPGESGLKGLEDAIARAAWLSMAKPPQRVVRVRPDDAERVIRRYRCGADLSLVEIGDRT